LYSKCRRGKNKNGEKRQGRGDQRTTVKVFEESGSKEKQTLGRTKGNGGRNPRKKLTQSACARETEGAKRKKNFTLKARRGTELSLGEETYVRVLQPFLPKTRGYLDQTRGRGRGVTGSNRLWGVGYLGHTTRRRNSESPFRGGDAHCATGGLRKKKTQWRRIGRRTEEANFSRNTEPQKKC